MPALTRKEHVAVVDPYSGGRYLIPAFQALGYPVIGIEASAPGAFLTDSEFARRRCDRYIAAGDQTEDDLVASLREAEVRVVLPGSEGGVLLADRLADRLGVSFANHIALSSARRDKFEMQERLRECGLACTRQSRVRSVAELDRWLEHHGEWPVVLKPLRSAGTDGVHICADRERARDALADILRRLDLYGQPNDAAVCQEFLVGDEYVMNGVVCRGELTFSEGWRSDKTDNAGFPVYDTQYLFRPDDPHFAEIGYYVHQVCDALGMTDGAVHAEIMLTATGPVLIEIGARPAGGADPYVIETCLGHSQIRYLVDAALRPDTFAARKAAPPPAVSWRRAAYVYLVARVHGTVRKVTVESFLDVKGVVSASYRYDVGQQQPLTRDLLSAAGVVMVVADDDEQLVARVGRIRQIESTMYAENIETEPSR